MGSNPKRRKSSAEQLKALLKAGVKHASDLPGGVSQRMLSQHGTPKAGGCGSYGSQNELLAN